MPDSRIDPHLIPEPHGTRSANPGGDRLIHEMVARQARRRPAAPALVFRGETMSYGQLDRAADTCARALLCSGVTAGRLVPVLLPRSPELVVALLGVLKCGAAYTAIDHRWPVERVLSVVRALAPPLLVTSRRLPGLDLPTWRPGQEPQRSADEAASAAPLGAVPLPHQPMDGSALATVFFTSGTTGEPKGVLSPHQATTRLFGPGGLPGFGPGRVMPQLAPVPWDGFTLELWGMLTTGGTSVIADDDYLLPDGLRAMVRAYGVDTSWFTSSLFNFFVDEDIDCFSGMRQVLTGGERLSAAHVRRFLSRHPEVALVNGYGPVESCVFVSTHRVLPVDCSLPEGIPIGRPVAGTEVYLLDGEDGDVTALSGERPLPPQGATGEICVAGDGLALGYLGDPAATAAKFITAAVDGRPVRLYRTGDIGHRDADGLLHFLGRRDRQLKISGHRIEPGEIEAVARRVPGLGECSVVAAPRPDGSGVDQLALIYTVVRDGTAAAGPPPEPDVVRRSLARLLPHHLVPHIIRRVAALPRTANGKADRAALVDSLCAPQGGDSAAN
ncbi:amino acid adenylation domain-containing protein [Streptomyces sp. NPDC005393]|uniref:amino acid adenylation domain-containing protein n=1 Tax=Streptomyces sp. NPDC005393 TaxID=3157041 RepID=UPI00339FFA11